MLVDGPVGIGGEFGIVLPADGGKTVFDIGPDLALLQRLEMIGGNDPLAQLVEFGAGEGGAELACRRRQVGC